MNIIMIQFVREDGRFEAALSFVKAGEMGDECLHPIEKLYYRQLKADKRRESYLMGRCAAKTAVSELTGMKALHGICIESGVFGFPVVNCKNVQVSISHCDEAAVAIAFPEHHPVGIDIEIVSRENMDTLETALVEKEKVLLASKELSTASGYTAVWSAKEALSKILKTGLTLDFEILQVQSVEQEQGVLVFKYKYFYQYKALVFPHGRFVITCAVPANSKVDIPAVLKNINCIKS